jgi:HAD superfamily hydrolase (TIGR01509 family)
MPPSAPPLAVLFDMDGVLVKSDETWFRCVEEAGVRFRQGRPVTREEFFPTFGQGTAADVAVFGLDCTPAQLDAFYAEAFLRYLDTMWINPDAAPLLSDLARRGIARAVVTNTVGPLTTEILTRAGLLAHFSVRATSDRVAHAKPAPDLVLLACRELGVAPERAWMVGDSRYDRGAAQAAGVRFVGLGLDGDLRIEALGELGPRLNP